MDAQAEFLISKTRDHEVMAKLIGKSEAFLKAIGQLPAIAKAEASVMITGETGTGKDDGHANIASRQLSGGRSDRVPAPPALTLF